MPQHGTLPRDADLQHIVARRADARLGQRPTRERHFAGAHQTALVVDVEKCRQFAGFLLQEPHQLRGIHGFEPFAQRFVGSGADQIVTVGHGIDIEPRTSHEERHAPAIRYVVDGGIGVRLVVGQREVVAGIGNIQQVVRDRLPLLGRDLARTEVVAAQDLPRIGRDDLSAVTPREFEPHGAFARGVGADDGYECRFHGGLHSERQR